jgi:CheY-like chemotaxis protein/HPt (histidine-containing phosphotransfer) domain-containing protein
LLAEDNETNRDVISEQLRLLGYDAEVAEDGAIALEKWRSGRFALLLTDCQMPNMDGFELTHAIRAEETASTRMPIIAVTGNAMLGEAQRCLTAGMDDYLSKPLRMHELGAMLTKWLPITDRQDQDAPDTESQTGRTKACDLQIWNHITLSEFVGDNPVLHRRLLEKFLRIASEQVSAIDMAVAAGNCNEVAALAHTLKSAARSVGALALGELCEGVETSGKAGDAKACIALTQKLPTAYTVAQRVIREHLEVEKDYVKEDNCINEC